MMKVFMLTMVFYVSWVSAQTTAVSKSKALAVLSARRSLQTTACVNLADHKEKVAISRQAACVINANQGIDCYGREASNEMTNKPTSGQFESITAVFERTFCALDSTTHKPTCWGDNMHSLLSAPNVAFTKMCGGNDWFCGIKEDDSYPRCWGNRNYVNFNPDQPLKDIFCGAIYQCGIKQDNMLSCNGNNMHSLVTGHPTEAIKMGAGTYDSACAIKLSDSTITCWGDSSAGLPNHPTGTFKWITAQYEGYCAIRDTDLTVACWASIAARPDPMPQMSVLYAGKGDTCGVSQTDGSLKCWGWEAWDELNAANLQYSPVCDARIKVCTCANGPAVSNDDCTVHNAEQCASCNDGYALSNLVCTARTCAVNGITTIADSCFCATETTACAAGGWCYTDACQTTAQYPTCTAHVTTAVAAECVCGTMTTTCAAGKYCWNSACTDAAHCQPRTNAQRKAFFGAKLHGTWDSNARTMNMYLPAPHDVTITEIKWKDATNGDALKYTSAAHGLWTVDTSVNACTPQYTLNVAEATFFGDGSKFTLTGTRMDTKLEVTASEAVTQTIDGTSYSFTREMKNEVHLDVELVQQVTINAHFTTRYAAAPNVDTIRINADFATINGNVAAFLLECNELFAGVTCASIAEGSVIITFTGEAAAIAAAIAALNAAGTYSTTNFGPYVIMQSHTEFVFVTGSENTDLENGDLQVKLKLEVHSRSCVNHATGAGVTVDSESTQYLKAGTTPTYAWIMDENDPQSVAHTFTNNLCVETLWWTWIPRDYQSSSYNIALDWTLRNGLPNFVTNAEIDIKRADVLATIGFDTNVALYTDAAATTSAEGTFNLGDKFYAKISLTNMVVDAQSITCSAMDIVQSPPNGGDNVVTDMKGNAIYNFVETQSSTNNVICGAELDSTHFHVSAEGYATNLNIDITVNYIQGVQSISRRRMLSIPVSGEREPEEDAVSIEMEITSPDGELALGVAEFVNENQILTAKYALFTTFLGFSWYAYGMTKGEKNQAEQYDELLI